MKDSLYIGMISGTSMDAVDCALVDFGRDSPVLLDFHCPPLPSELKQRILALCTGGEIRVQALGELDVELGRLFAATALELLERNRLGAADIAAIGSHGQTVFHQPPRSAADRRLPFSLQIADPNTLCELTGITTVADFRRRDMAAGGQGAPLVPAFHREIFHHPDRDRIILNVGGMSNITLLPAADASTPAYDTGPGNVLLDHWIALHRQLPFDADGAWAASGRCNEALLRILLDEAYFGLAPPKSTGRELFNGDWLQGRLDRHARPLPPEDVQATLLELTALTIRDEVKRVSGGGELIVCGGGARNGRLLERLAALLPDFQVAASTDFGLPADSVEAVAFAWMARQTLAGRAIDLREITGASHPCILGGIYRK